MLCFKSLRYTISTGIEKTRANILINDSCDCQSSKKIQSDNGSHSNPKGK